MFLVSAFAHFVALISPGPDTAIIIRQVSIYGRIAGVKTAIGIGFGILVHCVFAVTGISLIVLSNDLYKLLIGLIGGTYLLYLGINILISHNNTPNTIKSEPLKSHNFFIGFVTNIFNVKAFLFFLSLFTIIIDDLYGYKAFLYPIYFSVMTSIWFILLSYVMTSSKNNYLNLHTNKYIKNIMFIVLSFIGLLILIRSIYEYF